MAQSDWTRLGGISRDTYVATGANVEAYVSAQIGATYKAKGSLAFANLPTPGASYEGFVYNVTDAFTTTAAFVEGAGKNYPAGTNVVCVNTTGSTYAWDVLTGIVDLSGKQDKITASGILKGDGSGGVSAATAGTDYVASVSPASDAVVTVTGSSGALTVDHAKKGPSSSGNTSKGDTTNQTPGFGSTFKVLSATVDKYGHTTALAEHTVTIPSATAVASGSGSDGADGLMSAADKAKLDGLAKSITTVSGNNGYYDFSSGDANWLNIYGSGPVSTAMSDNSMTISVAAATPSTSGTGGSAGTMSATDKEKLNGVATGAQVNVIEGVKLAGASAALTPSSKIVTIPNAVATGTTGATNGLMTADQAAALATASTTASNNAAARKTTLKAAIDTMYSRTTYPDKQSLYAALEDMDDLADTLADLIIALRGFCDAS